MKTTIETLPRVTFTRLESLLICLLMSLLSTAARAAPPPQPRRFLARQVSDEPGHFLGLAGAYAIRATTDTGANRTR